MTSIYKIITTFTCTAYNQYFQKYNNISSLCRNNNPPFPNSLLITVFITGVSRSGLQVKLELLNL